MEEIQQIRSKCVYSASNERAFFSHKYMSYLLPALLDANENNKMTTDIEKVVRFEVDMALASSTDEFKWSRALKRMLEQDGDNANGHFSAGLLCTTPKIPRLSSRPRRVGTRRGPRSKTGFGCRVRILRRIVPGGGDMGVSELMSEVQSYVFCLQLQVKILRSLVDAQ